MLTVKEEVERLLKDMHRAAMTAADPVAERETTEIAAIVMAQSLPTIPGYSDSIINLQAQAAIVKAWRQHGENLQRAAGMAA